MRIIYIVFCVLLLIYMVLPGPTKVSDFSPLPAADKSTLSGDTVQVSNVDAYFSDHYRSFVIPFYFENYKKLSFLPFPPLRLNHPPEFSWNVIKRHTDSTYLEEFVYPLRDSLYVNGLEPFYEDGTPKFWGSYKLNEGKNLWYTKTTLRFSPSTLVARFIVWFGISLSMLFLFRLGKKIIFK
jgi:hypothetical protein